MNKKWKKKCKSSFKSGKCAGCAECGALLSDDDIDSTDDDDNDEDGLRVCLKARIDDALAQMDAKCQTEVYAAVANNEPLDAVQRCLCYLQVNASLASGINCKTMEAKKSSLAEEYAVCVAGAADYADKHSLCNVVDLNERIKQMTPGCKILVDGAIADSIPLTEVQRCDCYNEVDAASMLSLHCRTMEVKELTVAEEYQQCLSAKKDQ